MRRLGGALGVEAMSLYKHAANKDDVLDGVAELIMAGVEIPPSGGDWIGDLRAVGLALREAGLRHPAGFELLVRRLPVSDASMAPVEATLTALRAGGLGEAAAVNSFWLLVSYVLGAVLSELGAAANAEQGAGLPGVAGRRADDPPHAPRTRPRARGVRLRARVRLGTRRAAVGAAQRADRIER